MTVREAEPALTPPDRNVGNRPFNESPWTQTMETRTCSSRSIEEPNSDVTICMPLTCMCCSDVHALELCQ